MKENRFLAKCLRTIPLLLLLGLSTSGCERVDSLEGHAADDQLTTSRGMFMKDPDLALVLSADFDSVSADIHKLLALASTGQPSTLFHVRETKSGALDLYFRPRLDEFTREQLAALLSKVLSAPAAPEDLTFQVTLLEPNPTSEEHTDHNQTVTFTLEEEHLDYGVFMIPLGKARHLYFCAVRVWLSEKLPPIWHQSLIDTGLPASPRLAAVIEKINEASPPRKRGHKLAVSARDFEPLLSHMEIYEEQRVSFVAESVIHPPLDKPIPVDKFYDPRLALLYPSPISHSKCSALLRDLPPPFFSAVFTPNLARSLKEYAVRP